MTRTPEPQIALAAALDLPDGEGAPDWVHLLPSGGSDIRTFDGRGPYRLTDPTAVIAASWPSPDPRDAKGLLIDENHAQDKAAPLGMPSPARGRIVELQARADGIWGRVVWTEAGRAMVADHAYAGISPVFLHDMTGKVLRILRASLVNNPNLHGLAALNQESQVTFSAPKLAAAVGLKPEATEDEILAALPKPATALQSTMAEIGAALGVDSANAPAVVAAVGALKVRSDATVALQAENTTLRAENAQLITAQKRAAAESWMASEIAAKRGIPPEKREGLIALHMQNAAEAVAIAKIYPDLGETHTGGTPPGEAERAAETEDAALKGIQIAAQAEAYQKKQAAAGISIDYFTAVRAVSEGKK